MPNQETIDFIKRHEKENVRKLVFQAGLYPNVDMRFALEQISGKQIANSKLPSWANNEGIIYPPHISMEQCSSELTGRYKADVMKLWITHNYMPEIQKNTIFYDFTAGFGVDFSFLAPLFEKSVYVEQQPHLCEIAKHNLPLLNLSNAKVLNTDGEEIIKTLTKKNKIGTLDNNNLSALMELESGSAFAFLDPARRDSNGGRTYAIADCTPNIIGFIDELIKNFEVVMIKLSPMLDWHATVADINAATKDKNVVREVHIVSVNNECKELLLVVSCRIHSPLSVSCVDLPNSSFHFFPTNELSEIDDGIEEKDQRFLFVPNSSIMKAGCFKDIENAFKIKQLSKNSHLFVSDVDITYQGASSKDTQNMSFPGRIFRIQSISSMNKKELKSAIQGLEKANISTRNFPLSPDQLRKRLKLKDGGDIYIFATTTAQNEHLLYICKKL